MTKIKAGYEPRLVILMFLGIGTVMLDRMAQLFLGPYIAKALAIGPAQIGVLAAGVSFAWAISSFIFGLLSDRVGRKPVLIPAMILFSLFSAVSGLAQNFGQLLLIRILLGAAEGPCWTVIAALVAEATPQERRGRNMGIVISAAALVGGGLGPILTTQIASAVGWRWAFAVAGIPGLVLALIMLVFVREPQKHLRSEPAKTDLGRLLRYRNVWLCIFAAIGQATWLLAFNVFAPLYITRVMGQSPTMAGFLIGASGIGAFVLGFCGPAVSDKIGRRPALLVAAALAMLMPLLFLVPGLYHMTGLLAALIFVTATGSITAALTLTIIPAESVPPSLKGAAIGLAGMGGEIGGALCGPMLGGVLAQHLGLAAPLVLASAGMVLVLLLGLAMRETRQIHASLHDAPVPAPREG